MISFIIPWDERTQDTWRIKSFNYIYKYILLNFPEAEICIGTDNSEPFNRSKARNNAFEKSTKDILVILDADTLVPVSSIINSFNLLKDRWVIPYNIYYNLSQETTARILTKESIEIFEPDELQYEHKIVSWAGALILTSGMYQAVGGYDERFTGWGWEDVAFRIKLDAIIGKHIRYGTFVNHLWHPRGEADFNTPHELANRKLFDHEYRRKYNWKDERI